MELVRSLAAALILVSLAAPACGSGEGRAAPESSGGSAADNHGAGTTAGGSNNGAGSASGGSNSGGSSSGGSNSGGSNNGNAGSAAAMACHDASECEASKTPPLGGIPECLSPGQSPPFAGCGAPQWCGQCNCPEQPPQPNGTGMQCEASGDCPGGEGAASLCSQGKCTQCVSDVDCPESAPACSLLEAPFGASYRLCTACTSNQHCSGATPICQLMYGIGRCVGCQGNGDCAQGVCNGSECVPGCGPDLPCGSPLQECTAELRCVPRACNAADDCGTNADCSDGRCLVRTCDSDAECTGYCVNHRCFETLGTCFTLLAAP